MHFKTRKECKRIEFNIVSLSELKRIECNVIVSLSEMKKNRMQNSKLK